MNAVQQLTPYDLLRDIEARSKSQALGLPQQIEVRRTWSGIGFQMGHSQLVSPMGEIAEILEYPPLTRIPSAHHWVRGIANIRGSLLPVIDLQGFVVGENTQLERRSRVLVIEQGDLSCGLLIDAVFGLRHYFEEEKLDDVQTFADPVQEFLDGGYRQGDVDWGIFSMKKLAQHPRFREVAVRK